MKDILAFSGSNSSKSINQNLITRIGEEKSIVDIIDLRKFNIPVFGIDVEEASGIPEGIKDLVYQIKLYKKILISTPEHNGGLPAFFKNILDWISRYESKFLEEKEVIILSTSPGGRGGLGALDALENQLKRYTGAIIIHKQGIGSFEEKVEENKLLEEIKPVLDLI